MDALLRYTLYRIAYGLLFLEIALMVVFCVAIIVIKLITKWLENRRVHIQQEISKIIDAYLFSERPLSELTIPPDLHSFRNLVETLERYDRLYSDDKWQAIKHKIVEKYLLPEVDAYASSFFWVNRQLAARALLLYPRKASEATLAKLLDDKRYLVRVAAAVCITKTSHRELFYKMLQKMSQETELSQFPYRDAIIQCDEEKFRWITELLKREKDKKVIAICLDILSTRYSGDLLPLIKPYLSDPDHNCQMLAVKALGSIPDDEAVKLLMQHLNDTDWNVRAETINSLQKLYALQAIPKLKELLNDPVWWVRLQAALTLKNFGSEGMHVLTSQSKEKDPRAFEIAQYMLALP